ncbi:MAG: hypothetical protein KDC54_00950 [Lewinella sp.]|nr:hypothetical protein [Lewinella sp.]
MLALLVNKRSYRDPLWLATGLLFGGTTAYFLLWFNAFTMHDYYLLTTLVLPLFVWLSFLRVYRNSLAALKWPAYLIGGALVLNAAYYNAGVQYYRYHEYPKDFTWQEDAATLENYLREIGVPRTAKVVSIPDPSPNISLYLANNPGWTDALAGEIDGLDFYLDRGASYLIMLDTTALSRPNLEKYIKEKVGEHGVIQIFTIGRPGSDDE